MGESWTERGRAAFRRYMCWIVRHVPPGARTAVGLLLIAGGVFGFLPILGFWMIPLGLAVIALDLVTLRRWLLGRPRPGEQKRDRTGGGDRRP